MKNIILLLFIPAMLPGQVVDESISKSKPFPSRPTGSKDANRTKVIFEWTSPTESISLDIDQKEFEVHAIIRSNQKIKQEDITLKINDLIGSKANEVKLFSSQDEKEISYQAVIRTDQLSTPINSLILSVRLINGEQRSSPVLSLAKDGSNIDIIQSLEGKVAGVSLSPVDMFWIKPDLITLGDMPLVVKEHELEVSLRMETQFEVTRNRISFVVNNIFVSLSPEATVKSKNNKYSITDRITLREDIHLNKIQLLVKDPADEKYLSEVLKVNFSANKPNLYVLSVGTKTNLNYTDKDAEDFENAFHNQGGLQGNRLFKKVETDLLKGSQATASEIKGTIEELLIKAETGVLQESDLLVLFISSHGFLDDLSGEFRIQGDDFDARRSRSTSVSYKHDIIGILDQVPCKKMIFIDACHSGRGARASTSDVQKEIEKLNAKKEGMTVIVSSQEDEESYEDVSWRNGAFTEAILAGLGKGAADTNKNGLITINELFKYIDKTVPEMVAKAKGKPQHPKMLNDELGNVSIYVIE